MASLPIVETERALTPSERKAIFGAQVPKKRTGHAAEPGTGPSGETCQSCAHLCRQRWAKVYLKCDLMRARWTGGAGTDVKARDAACSKWEAGE
ncbi:MAG: hypothetical protein WC683_18765 [bacterium]